MIYTPCKVSGMDKDAALKKLRTTARKLSRANERRDLLVDERDEDIRAAKAAGASWKEMMVAAGTESPTTVTRALKKAETT